MRLINVTNIFLFVLAVAGGLSAQSGCPGCTLALSDTLPQDTIFIGETVNGTYNEYYEADLSFRLPTTTTPVANNGGNIPPGLNIGSIEILNVLNVPPGLSWEASETFFEVIDGETDGCVRFCGTPLLVDTFLIEVVLEATLFITQQTSAFVTLIIEPATASNDGFSLTNNEGCGSVTVDFTNNVPSNGAEGFSYDWDFGNGAVSADENPGPQTYSEPGTYPVDYVAIIDTTGYFLTAVTVLETDCNDIFGGNPDLKVNVFDPDGTYIYTSDIADNTDTPVSYSMFVPIGEGAYGLQIVDDDGGLDGADDDCGTIPFTRDEDGTFSIGSLTISFTIFHPTETVTGTDTVYVYPQPEAPVFAEIIDMICPDESISLEVTNFSDGLTWMLDSVNLNLPDSQNVYVTNVPGEYQVTYASPDGCLSTAIAPVFGLFDPVDTVFISNDINLIEVDSSDLPPNVEYVWELDGVEIDETSLRFCAVETGTYTLVLTDVNTRCSSRSSIFVAVDPTIFCDVTSVAESIAAAEWRVYPNPGQGPLTVSGNLRSTTELTIKLVDVTGRTILQQRQMATSGSWSLTLDKVSVPAGLYYLLLTDDRETIALPVVRR